MIYREDGGINLVELQIILLIRGFICHVGCHEAAAHVQ
jgi:hypothetical protein